MMREFVLALDEAWVRGDDGAGQLVTIPATEPTALDEQIRGLAESSGRQVMAVMYVKGEDRNERSRRLVTPAVTVAMAPGAEPARIAEGAGAVAYEVPTYAPDHVVLQVPGVLGPLRAAVALAGTPGVAFAMPQLARQHAKRAMPNDPLVAKQWHLNVAGQTGAVAGTDVNLEGTWAYPTAGAGRRGRGIHVGIVDDGLETAHPDLAANVDTSVDRDWNGNDADPNPGTGDDHGTACAGNVAAIGNNGVGVSGSAPEAKLVGMRLISSSVTDSAEAEAMTYRSTGATPILQVLSNSWGPADTGTTLEGPGPLTLAALKAAAETGRGGKGTIITWAGGNGLDANDNSNCDGYANSIYTIAVGALDSQSGQAWYSEPGANLVVVAPSSGNVPALDITTTDRSGSLGYNSGSTAGELSGQPNYTQTFGGTSSAAPTVSGIVALMLEANPNLGWRDVQEILMRSARKVNPSDADWKVPAAPDFLNHNHKFGAGLVDATAAVNLAAAWSNLPAQLKRGVAQTSLAVAIPNNNATGITREFTIGAQDNLRTEHATVKLNILHTARGNLEITLTSPSGTVSRLAEVHGDSGDHYPDWTFMTVRHWGENAAGTWVLRIADKSGTGNTTGGTLTAASLDLYGGSAAPLNPPPSVALTTPVAGAVFSPGSNVTLEAGVQDRDVNGNPGTIERVEFLVDGQVVHADTAAPWSYTWQPGIGVFAVAARATDNEGASATSGPITLEVRNQVPVITAGALSAGAEAFSDEAVQVVDLAANDPEGAALDFTYQWQSSLNGVAWLDAAGLQSSTLPASPDRGGKLWRCTVRASDGVSTSEPWSTPLVSIRNRPVTRATVGVPYRHDPGLYVPAVGGEFRRQAILHEFSQGSNGGEWLELLTLKQGSLASYGIQDSSGNRLGFTVGTAWEAIPAGTLVVIRNGTTPDPLLPLEDTDPRDDGRMVLSSTNASFFDPLTAWPALGNSGDGIVLTDPNRVPVSQVGYGNNLGITPNVGTVNSGRAAYYTGTDEDGAASAANWRTTTAATARSLRVVRAPGDLFFSEYVEGSGNNKALEIHNPSAAAVDLAAAGYQVLVHANGSTTATAIKLSGTIQPGGVHVLANSSASTAIVAQQKSGSLGFNGDDAVALRKGGATGGLVDVIGQIGVDPGTAWTAPGVSTLDTTLRRKSKVAQGDPVGNDAFDPSLEWDAFAVDSFAGLGSHTGPATGPTLSLAVVPASVVETAGSTAAIGTLTLSAALTQDLAVNLLSSDPSEATVPASLTVPAGSLSVTFAIAAVDDAEADGTQSVTITAAASGLANASTTLVVTDNEPSYDGVTPGAGNTPDNATFIGKLRAGVFGQAPQYRLAAGSTLPPGLALDPQTGTIAGSPTTAGTYPIAIERHNALGEVASQSYTLVVAESTTPTGHPPFQVTAMTLVGGTCTLSWESRSGASYAVEVSENPTDPASWSVLLDAIPSQGALTTLAIDLAATGRAGVPRLFLRVRSK